MAAFADTPNGSGVAFARLIAAILEICRQKDGSATIPEALHPHMGGMERIERE